MPATKPRDVVVIGGGVIGLSIAWQTALRGLSVAVIDPDPGSGASHFAAGMLTPATEAHYGEEFLLALNLASAHRYPSFVAELEAIASQPAGYRACGALSVAFDADDKAVLDDMHTYLTSLGLGSQPLKASECRTLEPMLTPSIRGGLFVEDDHQIDSRRLVAALIVACERSGVTLIRERARQIIVDGDHVAGVDDVAAGQVVLAAGAWSRQTAGVPDHVIPPVRPVKGQIVRLRQDPQQPLINRTVRAFVRGRPIYLVPRIDGEVVLGATAEEMGFDTTVTVGAVEELLEDARRLVPGVTELELTECSAGLRPGSPDNAPLIGPTALRGLVLATGHYRNGILLTPITADTVSDYLATGVVPELLRPFDPRRFVGQPA